jgi:RNA polymerase sigma factor (TIGR02999 family)
MRQQTGNGPDLSTIRRSFPQEAAVATDSNRSNPDPAEEALRAEATRLVQAVDPGGGVNSAQLLEMVYDQLRELARARIAGEPKRGAGLTLEATALVHEAYLRIIGGAKDSESSDAPPPRWENRGHFFGAAALAMRRILVERARHTRRLKRGGDRERVDLHTQIPEARDGAPVDTTDLIALDDALTKLEQLDQRKAMVVTLRYFSGLTVEETANAMDLSPATVKNEWAMARAWLHRELTGETTDSADTPS